VAANDAAAASVGSLSVSEINMEIAEHSDFDEFFAGVFFSLLV